MSSCSWSTARRCRIALLAASASALLLYLDSFTPALAFTFDDVVRQAEQLAATAYKKPSTNLPKEIQSLGYDQYRDIRFRSEKAYWHNAGLPFELMFFHQGYLFVQPVRINEINGHAVRNIKFDPSDFDYGKTKVDPNQLKNVGFAGFRVHFPLNISKYKDEVLTFLGASYFRALGKGQRYGLSARGLAVDTGLASGEEFPYFVEFWIERPHPAAKELTIYGLLDSPRAAGAYRFVLTPGPTTSLDVMARLYLRENVGKLGLGSLTSMFFFGANQPPSREDFRPEVHDSDGLSVHSSTGEWIWRPLVNPKQLLITSFATANVLGFGLMQRAREFWHYEDLEARYDLRPSAWVEPRGGWGPGKVELVMIPVPNETNDNIVAYWVPDNPPPPKKPYDFEYRILWQSHHETRPLLSWVTQTRRGRGYTRNPDNSIEFSVDFDGPALKNLPKDAAPEADISVDANGELLEHHAYRNEVTGGWRLMVRFRRLNENKPVELRAFLRRGSEVLSETWSYILPPG